MFSQLENGCSGVFVMIVSSSSPKVCRKPKFQYFFLCIKKFIYEVVPLFLLDILESCWLEGHTTN